MKSDCRQRKTDAGKIKTNCVRRAPVYKTKELVFVDRLLLSVNKNKLKKTGTPTDKVMQRADGTHRIISAQQHMLTIDKNSVQNRIYIDQATAAISDNTNAGKGEEQNAVVGEKEISNNELSPLESKIAETKVVETEQGESDDRATCTSPKAAEIINTHEPRQSKSPDVYNDDNDQFTPEETETDRGHSGKPVLRPRNVRDEKVYIRKYAVDRKAGNSG